MPFASKGYTQAYQMTLHRTLHKFWDWSEGGSHPIVIEPPPAHTRCRPARTTLGIPLTVRAGSAGTSVRDGRASLSAEDRELWQQLTMLDSLEFLHDQILPRLNIQPLAEDVVLHPNCSARKLGLDAAMLSIAQQCARSATVPLSLGCCAFAGDRGLLFPELTASATEAEAAEVLAHDFGGYYSSNIPCEIGMSEATGQGIPLHCLLGNLASR